MEGEGVIGKRECKRELSNGWMHTLSVYRNSCSNAIRSTFVQCNVFLLVVTVNDMYFVTFQ